MPASSKQTDANSSSAVWYLGIDFGTTGISAVLLNYSTRQRYPISWSHEVPVTADELPTETSQITPPSSEEPIFRLPAVAYSEPAASKRFVEQAKAIAPIVVGSLASTLAHNQPGVLLENFKSYLNLGIPYYCPQRHKWEPTLQLPAHPQLQSKGVDRQDKGSKEENVLSTNTTSSQQVVSLYWVRQAVQALFATLKPNSTQVNTMLKVAVQGLAVEMWEDALQHLEGVILGCPAAWGETYHFNLREAVLAAKLVDSPEQIFFLEDAIASVLAALPTAKSDAPTREKQSLYEEGEGENFSTQTQNEEPSFTPLGDLATLSPKLRSPSPWHGGTLVINAGATTTELALVDLPDDLQELRYSDFSLCSLPYAGQAIAQDIFCQLLYPQLSGEQQQQLSLSDDLEFPQPGQPDPQRRDRLALLLQSSSLGQAFLKAAGCLKLILQHKGKFTLDLGKERFTLTRLDLEDRVVQPFIQQLHQKLNALLLETGISEHGIYQVLLLGGSANLIALTEWIHKRLPNATVIRDTDSPGGSWVAAGLATLPLYPQLLNRSRQQYSDYFLFLELLRAFPETAPESAERLYRLEEIMQQLEHRGLNTRTCYERLVHLIEGHLPEGLVPSLEKTSWLFPTSHQNPLYSQVAASTGLFLKEGHDSSGTGQVGHLYRRNLQQQALLRYYMQLVLSGIYQKFEEPLLVSWI
ncbi:hypothetical protein [Allocoleopsis sp.]|uniref:hypothetical protein n=1 Tax=Allocoleopsis sp. TaxID=3088169 RepID=UPI002FD1CE3E